MTERVLLGGRVRITSIPMLTAPTAADAPILKRLQLPQGELAQFYDGDEGMRYLAMIQLKPGTVRGNHYHLKKLEWVYVVAGRVEMALRERDGGEVVRLQAEGGDLARIDTGIVHAFRPLEEGLAIEFSPQRHEAQDTFRLPILI